MVSLLHFYSTKSKEYKYLLLCIIFFSYHETRAVNYYVNDTSLKGDLYTKTIGNDNNDGLSPDSPKLTISAAYQKAKEGDTIFVDTGNYSEINTKGELRFENKKNIHFIIRGQSEDVFTKTPFPANEKNAPDVFYIKNDKPVSREVYLNNPKEK
ncbi:hypothetical protein [Flavobacterium phycosphaerae]|uniref:hypothetical protein n=1 Tax=Flavobacterium phycosphaerae TaxID=2697515 RepID=UPI00138AD3A0|nr:hypothetical protein [Flavobacterium phycosphaerae]